MVVANQGLGPVEETSARAGGAFALSVPSQCRALDDEIRALRENGGQRTFLADGRSFGRRAGHVAYVFTSDSELRFPDDTPVEVEVRGRKHDGVVVSVAGFEVVLALDEDLGETVPTAVLFTSPWFLLRELQRRLEAAVGKPGANRPLAESLLGALPTARAGHPARTARLLAGIGVREKADYNPAQFTAIDHALHTEISFIWGPPGTGKTQTLALTVAALVAAGASVLIVAHSNAAVDVALERVAQQLCRSAAYLGGEVLRFGGEAPGRLDPYPDVRPRQVARRRRPDLVTRIEQLEECKAQVVRQTRREDATRALVSAEHAIERLNGELRPLRDGLRAHEAELVRAATVVACTLSKAAIAPEVYERHFDAVVIDEASMAYIPHCLFVATLARERLAVFGDFRQLATIAQADTEAARRWLHRDVFEAAGIVDAVVAARPDPRLVLLDTQYRMHPVIAALPNTLFYGGRLRNGPSVAAETRSIAAVGPEPGMPLVLYDVGALGARTFRERQSNSRFNLLSALLAVRFAAERARDDGSVGIITPYNAQARLLVRFVRDLGLHERGVKVATVHRFQGSEADAIIFDTVDGPPIGKPSHLLVGSMGSGAMRLANVAVSRARGKFVVLADHSFLRKALSPNDSVRQLLELVAAVAAPRGILLGTAGIPTEELLPGVWFFRDISAATEQLHADVTTAKEEIAVRWPGIYTAPGFTPALLRHDSSGRVRLFLTVKRGDARLFADLPNKTLWETATARDYGLIAIDRRRLWVYLTPASTRGEVLRIDLPGVAKLLSAFWQLVPEDEAKRSTLQDRVDAGKSPLGPPCQVCGGSLWLEPDRYGVSLVCTSPGCGYKKHPSPNDATDLARLMQITCGVCGGQVRGRKGSKGVFLGCVSYPTCTWTKSLESLV